MAKNDNIVPDAADECSPGDGIQFGPVRADRTNTTPIWSTDELMYITKLFDGMYTCMWEYTHRTVAHLTIQEKPGLYNSTKIKALLRFIDECRNLKYVLGFDNSLGIMLEGDYFHSRSLGNTLRKIDWPTALERVVADGTLPQTITFYLGKSSDGK